MSKLLSATRGSGALKLDYTPQNYREISERVAHEHIEEERKRERQERQRREAARKKANKLKFRVMITALVCITFAVFSVVVLGYSKISSITLETNKLKSVVSEYETEIEALKLDISMSTDLETIKEEAETRLNMGAPKDYQMFGIDMQETDVDLQAEQIPVNETIDTIRELLD